MSSLLNMDDEGSMLFVVLADNLVKLFEIETLVVVSLIVDEG